MGASPEALWGSEVWLKVSEDEWQVKQALKNWLSVQYTGFLAHVESQGYRVCVCVLSHLEVSDSLWPHACQAPVSMEFSRQEYWSAYSPDSMSSSCCKSPGHRHSARSLVRDNIRVCRMQGKCISNRAFSLAICTQGMGSAQLLLQGKAAPEFRMQVTNLPRGSCAGGLKGNP